MAGPFSACELWQAAKTRDAALALDTVYRNLSLLHSIGYLLVIGGAGKEGARYEVAADLQHHHHIVCAHCGAMCCLAYCPLNDELLQQVKACGYELLQHQVELIGVCHDCRHGGGPG